ncbi:unnamed protein product [Cercospora beticola]|nr:unnamed protein product [Cercospora beticola]
MPALQCDAMRSTKALAFSSRHCRNLPLDLKRGVDTELGRRFACVSWTLDAVTPPGVSVATTITTVPERVDELFTREESERRRASALRHIEQDSNQAPGLQTKKQSPVEAALC